MKTMCAILVGAVFWVDTAHAERLSIATVPVGNPGNAGELSGFGGGGSGPDRICGAVSYTYNIGKYEVTTGQYVEFLNAVAATDTYDLYNSNMWSGGYGCRIERSGSPGGFTYSVADDRVNRPVNYVSHWDACRFANWLHNGQPSGAQGPGTTETGAYTLDGYNGEDGRDIQRNENWKWALTSEDEWYKAAYHMNDGVTGHYWDIPMGSCMCWYPLDNENPDGECSANFFDGDYTVGSPYWCTEVGYFGMSGSFYGTFDQGGNVWERNESLVYTGSGWSSRGARGGSFREGDIFLFAAFRNTALIEPPSYEHADVGFRVSQVPEPGTMTLLSLLTVRQFRGRTRARR